MQQCNVSEVFSNVPSVESIKLKHEKLSFIFHQVYSSTFVILQIKSSCLLFIDSLLLHYWFVESRSNRGRRKKRQILFRGNLKRCDECFQSFSNSNSTSSLRLMENNSEDIFEVFVLSPQTSDDPVSYPDSDHCSSCKRISTYQHHLTIHSVTGSNLHKREIYSPPTTTEIVLLFLVQISFESRSTSFKILQVFANALPSVFWKLLSDDSIGLNFWQYLPLELRQRWLHRGALSNNVFNQRV